MNCLWLQNVLLLYLLFLAFSFFFFFTMCPFFCTSVPFGLLDVVGVLSELVDLLITLPLCTVGPVLGVLGWALGVADVSELSESFSLSVSSSSSSSWCPLLCLAVSNCIRSRASLLDNPTLLLSSHQSVVGPSH
ncbi:hypothetical protein M514_13727 [Trichuris suis]|uniref:Uncharacterized protein n=1 Tax=Trichuris suis TaxID=68888 RepID=A0A085N3R9_9BILA|nr:hypothetical protein M514_13727 [Trichuris suis]